ncbi:MAG: radical SAM protein, partial [Lachnospiraceae bacterium]|nr:radical SAM protein [Lachnospiraceae bacterium]
MKYKNCMLCPRACGVDRTSGATGVCGQSDKIRAARAALHFWEEPCISGADGSGAVFFSGCNLRCVFCQNEAIAKGTMGKEITPERLTQIFFELKEQGANNINLVTAGHFLPGVIKAMERAREEGFDLPFVYNTSGYEEVDSIRALDGLVDIYLPDLKYVSPQLSARYSHAKDYFEKASRALEEMVRQTGEPVFYVKKKHEMTMAYSLWEKEASCGIDSVEYNQICDDPEVEILMSRGTIVRHLLLPGQTEDSKAVIRYLYETYGDEIYISIMNQFTPLFNVADY